MSQVRLKSPFFLSLVTLLAVAIVVWVVLPAWKQWQNPTVNAPRPASQEVLLDLETASPLLKPVLTQWQGYITAILAGDESLTYAKGIELALSTVGENTWYIKSDAGIYEDASQKQLLMKGVTGRLESKTGGRSKNVLSLESAFAEYNATTEVLVLKGRSKVTVYP
ncbi:MAG: hypothetical protein LW809_02490 [Vampirovibrionales bacterium]|jgi:hypothetical protein|nr:hypothetical protein [Vampirovibrionales bacterium]